jgi:hypothetical protein
MSDTSHKNESNNFDWNQIVTKSVENYYQCGFGGIRFPHVKEFDSLSFKDYQNITNNLYLSTIR